MKVIKARNSRFWQYFSMPIIWSLLPPLVVFDLWVEFYHRTCFPMYGLKYVKRSDYIKLDRHRLSYLPWYFKLGCVYCGYANGLVHYWTTIFAETERYFCGIAHKTTPNFHPPQHHKDFAEFGNQEEYQNKYL